MSLLVYLLCACLVALAASKPEPAIYVEDDAHMLFERFILEYNKQYIDETEKLARREIFIENLRKADMMNRGSGHAVFGITQFMDLTEDEFVQKFTGLRANPLRINVTNPCTPVSDDEIPDYNAPESHDWRQYNAVTRVKNQQSCLGCYAFSATGNIEGQFAIKHKRLLELSEQQIIDCDRTSDGCEGGFMTNAFRTLIQQGGIETEQSYPFVNRQQQCHFTPGKAAIRLTDCKFYNLASQEKLKQLVFGVGPISVAVQSRKFQVYRGGVMMDSSCNYGPVDHGVLLVGYGTENGIPYWLIKNSWGESFGEKGYIKIQRGVGSQNAHSCGMMNQFMASSVVM